MVKAVMLISLTVSPCIHYSTFNICYNYSIQSHPPVNIGVAAGLKHKSLTAPLKTYYESNPVSVIDLTIFGEIAERKIQN